MFQKEQWPFIPDSLREIFDGASTLTVVEAGCCERIKRALTLIEVNAVEKTLSRVDSVNPKQCFEEFCQTLRNHPGVHCGEKLCQSNDLHQAQLTLDNFLSTGELYREFTCHMRLTDAAHIIRVYGRPIAVLFTGQYSATDNRENIRQRVRELIRPDEKGLHITEEAQPVLLKTVDRISPLPPDLRQSLEREALHIQQIAEAEFQRNKNEWEQEFLNHLLAQTRDYRDGYSSNSPQSKQQPMGDGRPNHTGAKHMEKLRACVHDLLQSIVTFCRCKYALFFANIGPMDNVLIPLAATGVSPHLSRDLPHFNWRKAGFSVGTTLDWEIDSSATYVARGLRGNNCEAFADVSCVLPTARSDRHRGVLMLGPFEDEVELTRECSFLTRVSDILCSFVFIKLEMGRLEQEQQHWKSAAQLLRHQIGTALTPITNQIQLSRMLADAMDANHPAVPRIRDLLHRAEDLSFQLSKGAKETITGHLIQIEHDDLHFERYPASVFVVNCVESFATEAKAANRQLVIEDEKRVEALPAAEIDVARLTIALGNILNNAIKYSFESTTIKVRAFLEVLANPEAPQLIIEVDDLGFEIPYEDRERIFEEGTRSLTRAKMRTIPGSGFGLWEARAVVEAHGGKIAVVCDKTSIHRTGGASYKVVFTLRIPLHQTRREGKGVNRGE